MLAQSKVRCGIVFFDKQLATSTNLLSIGLLTPESPAGNVGIDVASAGAGASDAMAVVAVGAVIAGAAMAGAAVSAGAMRGFAAGTGESVAMGP